MCKVFIVAHDEIGIRLKPGTKVYVYLKVSFERLKLFKDGLNHFLLIVMSRPHARPGPKAEPDPRTWTDFTIYTFLNTIEINVA